VRASDTDQLRQLHRRNRAELTRDIRQQHARSLAERVATLAEFKNAASVAAYIAIKGEMDLEPLLQSASCIQFYLPVLRGETMHFSPWTPGEQLIKKRFGLLEPDKPDDQWISPAQLDLVLVPLVVFDQRCNRIGQGGGYYDRTFAFCMRENREDIAAGANPKPVLLGVAYESQREACLQPENWDVPLDVVATESAVYRRD